MRQLLLLLSITVGFTTPVLGNPFGQRIPMFQLSASTFYVTGTIEGAGSAPLLVDTGSSYSVIDQPTLDLLNSQRQAVFVRKLTGVMADGSKKVVPVYRIPRIRLSKLCVINDVEVVVFPGKTRMILGLNVLRQLAPFAFSLDDDSPKLLLSNCQPGIIEPAPELLAERSGWRRLANRWRRAEIHRLAVPAAQQHPNPLARPGPIAAR